MADGFKLPNIDIASIASNLPVIGPIVTVGRGVTQAAGALAQKAENLQKNKVLNPGKAAIESRLKAQASSFASQPSSPYQINIVSVTKDPSKPITSITAFLPEEISLDINANYTAPFGEGAFDLSGGTTNKVIRALGVSGITQEASVKIWESTDGVNLSIPLTFIAGEFINGREQKNILEPIMDLMSLCTPSKQDGNFFLTPPGPIIAADFSNTLTGVAAAINIISGKNLDGTATSAQAAATTETVDVVQKVEGYDLSTAISDAIEAKKRIADARRAAASSVLSFDPQISVWIGDFLYFDNVVINGVSQNYKMILDDFGRPMQAVVQVTFTTMLSPTIEDLRKIFKLT